MNRAWLLLIVLLPAFFPAQAQDSTEWAFRDSLIVLHFEADRYEKALELLYDHLTYLEATDQTDSLYLYAYKIARSEWKVNGPEAGIRRMEDLVDGIERTDPDTTHILIAVNDLSWIYWETGRPEKCIEADTRYLELCDRYSKSTVSMRSQALYNLGFDYLSLGKGNLAVEYFRRALEPLAEDDFSAVNRTVETYNALGAALFRIGDLEGAKAAYHSSLQHIPRIEVESKINGNLANCYNNLALIAESVGDLITARDYYEKMIKTRILAANEAIEVWDRDHQRRLLLSGYRNLSAAYITMGDYSRAKKLIDLRDEIKSQVLEPEDPYNWHDQELRGMLNLLIGNMDRAEIHFSEFAKRARAHYGPENIFVANAHRNLAELAIKRENFDLAVTELDTAISVMLKISSTENAQGLPGLFLLRAESNLGAGNAHFAEKDLDLAETLVDRTRPPTDPIRSRIYSDRSKLARMENRLDEAIRYADKAIAVIEDQLENQVNGVHNPVFVRYLPEAYHERALCELQRDDGAASKKKALDFLNRAIENLATSRRGIMSDNDRSMLYDLHHEIFDLASEINYALYAEDPDRSYIEALLDLSEENKSLMIRYQLHRLSSTKFEGIPDSLIARERFLIKKLSGLETPENEEDVHQFEEEYKVLTAHIRSKYPEYYEKIHDIPTVGLTEVKRELVTDDNTLIEYISSRNNLFALVVSRDAEAVVKLEVPDLEETVEAYNRAIAVNDREAYETLEKKLYRSIFKPLEHLVVGEELVIIPAGPLFTLNFEALKNDEGRYLLEEYVISYQLSANAAVEFKRKHSPLRKYRVLAVAPGFSDGMKKENVRQTDGSAFFDTDYLNLIRQPFAVETAKNIARLFPGKGLLEDMATEANLRKEMVDSDILFFGTHAELNKESPMLSRLVMSKSPSVDLAEDDGSLYVYEIYELQLNAGLAILTACATGGGKASPSEGIYSLAHGFAYAGTPNIVMSLWEIDEKSSAAITENFMRRLKRGERKDRALRQAKIDFMQTADPYLQSPYFWAGLVLMGDGEPLVENRNDHWLWISSGGFLFVIVIAVSMYRKRSKSGESELSSGG